MKSKGIELAEIILKYAVATGAALWVLISGKDLVEARKSEGERAHTEVLTTQEQWKLRPRGEATISSIPSDGSPWISDRDLCSISGRYTLKNIGGAPIDIHELTFRVYEVPLVGAPPPDQQVVSFSTNVRLASGKVIHQEKLPDSDGHLLPEETYSRSFGFVVRRSTAMQYAVVANPSASYPGPQGDVAIPDGQFQQWTNLTGICLPAPSAGASSSSSASQNGRPAP